MYTHEQNSVKVPNLQERSELLALSACLAVSLKHDGTLDRRARRDSENGPSACPVCQSRRQVFCIGTVDAYSAKYSTIVEYKILELFQY